MVRNTLYNIIWRLKVPKNLFPFVLALIAVFQLQRLYVATLDSLDIQYCVEFDTEP